MSSVYKWIIQLSSPLYFIYTSNMAIACHFFFFFLRHSEIFQHPGQEERGLCSPLRGKGRETGQGEGEQNHNWSCSLHSGGRCYSSCWSSMKLGWCIILDGADSTGFTPDALFIPSPHSPPDMLLGAGLCLWQQSLLCGSIASLLWGCTCLASMTKMLLLWKRLLGGREGGHNDAPSKLATRVSVLLAPWVTLLPFSIMLHYVPTLTSHMPGCTRSSFLHLFSI